MPHEHEHDLTPDQQEFYHSTGPQMQMVEIPFPNSDKIAAVRLGCNECAAWDGKHWNTCSQTPRPEGASMDVDQHPTGPYRSQQRRLTAQFDGRPPEEVIAELRADLEAECQRSGILADLARSLAVAMADWETATLPPVLHLRIAARRRDIDQTLKAIGMEEAR